MSAMLSPCHTLLAPSTYHSSTAQSIPLHPSTSVLVTILVIFTLNFALQDEMVLIIIIITRIIIIAILIIIAIIIIIIRIIAIIVAIILIIIIIIIIAII